MGTSKQQRVAEIVAQYPDPVVVEQAHWVRALNVTLFGVMSVAGFLDLLQGEPFGFLLLGGAIIWSWILVSVTGRVRLDADGFAIEGRRTSESWRWSDVENFRAEFNSDGSDVQFDLGSATASTPRKAVKMRNTSGLSHGTVVLLMQQWQDLALSARATAECASATAECASATAECASATAE